MVGQLRASRHSFRLAWAIFLVALLAWFILRGTFKFGAVCDVLIVIALGAQAWLLFLQADKHQ